MSVFLDRKMAFDTVDHNIVHEKCKLYGIRGNIYRWFMSYITEISQYVEYNNCKSEKKNLTHGVQQGSSMGPLLFIIYIKDFSRTSDILFSILFSNDTNVFFEGTNFDYICEILNNELEKVNIWSNANKLTVNVKKAHYMMFHRKRINHNHNIKIYINKNSIDRANNTKFLGIRIDSN